MEIIPAILAQTEGELRNKLAAVPLAAEWVHVDFVAPATREILNSGVLRTRGSLQIPEFEAHLMLPDPRASIDDLVRAGFSRLIVQAECISPETFADLLHEWRAAVEVVPALEIETPLSVIDSFAHELKSVQLMGIAEIGAQGRPFDPRVVPRVKILHAQYPHLTIAVDGGVKKENAARLAKAGASRLVVGSHIHEFST